MRQALVVSLLLAPACTSSDDPTVTTTDTPITVAVLDQRVVVAANEATEETGFGCGGGMAQLGRSVLFVSGDRGETFERIEPTDSRPLVRLAVHDGVFYGIAHDNSGAFGVVTSADGKAWTEVANAPRYAQDLAVADDLLVVAHATGVMTSPDGSTWTDHDLGEGYYQASVARTAGTVALGTGVDGKLHLSTDAIAWRQQAVANFTSISQVVGANGALVVTGFTDDGPAMARVDLEGQAVVRAGAFMDRAVLTPAGLLDATGKLATIDPVTGVSTPVQHVDGFTSAAVDGNTVILARPEAISISRDGGQTFGAPLALPIVRTEAPAAQEVGEPRG